MHRVETIGNQATLYLGDCREIIPTLPKFDAMITDPPFNAGKDFQNDNMGADEWRAFCGSVAGVFAGAGATNYLVEVGKSDVAMRSALDQVLPYRWALALNYTNAMRNGAVGYANFGLVYWYGGKCYKRYMDRIDAALDSTLDQFKHPSPKEPRHYARLIEMFSPEQGAICDPFMGSGTTGVAAIKMGRKFVGIEIEPTYFEIALRRMHEAHRQPDLFIDRHAPPTQLGWDDMWAKPMHDFDRG